MSEQQGKALVDATIVRVILPMTYALIDELLDAKGAPSKDLVLRCRRLLPHIYRNSFAAKEKT